MKNTAWKPANKHQEQFINSTDKELLIHGTRYMGGTETLINSYLKYVGLGFGYTCEGIIIFKNKGNMINSKHIINKMLAEDDSVNNVFNFSDSVSFTWKTGEILTLAVCADSDKYMDKYFAKRYSFIGFDNIEMWSDSTVYDLFVNNNNDNNCIISPNVIYRCTGLLSEPIPEEVKTMSFDGSDWVRKHFIDTNNHIESHWSLNPFVNMSYVEKAIKALKNNYPQRCKTWFGE